MIGLIYLIKSNEYIGYHPKKGFFKTETLKYLDDDIIWLSNLKTIDKEKDILNMMVSLIQRLKTLSITLTFLTCLQKNNLKSSLKPII